MKEKFEELELEKLEDINGGQTTEKNIKVWVERILDLLRK